MRTAYHVPCHCLPVIGHMLRGIVQRKSLIADRTLSNVRCRCARQLFLDQAVNNRKIVLLRFMEKTIFAVPPRTVLQALLPTVRQFRPVGKDLFPLHVFHAFSFSEFIQVFFFLQIADQVMGFVTCFISKSVFHQLSAGILRTIRYLAQLQVLIAALRCVQAQSSQVSFPPSAVLNIIVNPALTITEHTPLCLSGQMRKQGQVQNPICHFGIVEITDIGHIASLFNIAGRTSMYRQLQQFLFH